MCKVFPRASLLVLILFVEKFQRGFGGLGEKDEGIEKYKSVVTK